MNNIELANAMRSEQAKERVKSMPGKRFGNVTVIGFAETNSSGFKRVLVKCDCGNEYPLTARYLHKRCETRCQRCSQILRHRGNTGYIDFLKSHKSWICQKGADNDFRGLKRFN